MSLLSWLKSKVQASQKTRLQHESEWIVTLNDAQISCKRPNGLVESLAWDDLKVVLIETTDEGPFAIDVFWILMGEQSGCIVPLGAAGADEMLAKLQALPNFNNEAVVEAMSSTDNGRFVCWQRSDAT